MLETLAIHWDVDPVIFSLGAFEIRWYSLLFISGFILGWFFFKWFCKREGLSEKVLDPLLYTLLIGTIVGARLGHCLFYNPIYYFGVFIGRGTWDGFFEVFMPWKGGLASHGGTLFLFFALIWFAYRYGKKYNFDFWWLLDHLAIATAFAAMFIRLGNLFNSEIYGHATDLPWGFIFDRRGEVDPKHPTQLYEALSYALLGVVLLILYAKRVKGLYRGSYMGIFFIVVFGMRFIIEFVKENQVAFEDIMVLNMGQWLSIPFILGGIALLVYSYRKKLPIEIVHPQQPVHPSKKNSR